ncbi:HPP family protein [Micromonospora coxensis]|uniref:HPP family protein n=1 Tax=Micromonospora coxensis TaxID=356852 RepID=UPI003442879E
MGQARQSAHAFAGSALAVLVAGVVALLTHQPWLFPSLGPAVMLHVEKPASPESSPRNTLIGHGVALLAGYASLLAFGLADAPSVLQEGVSGLRIVAAAGSLALTALVLVLLKASHPPAGATTLIVSLGLLRTPTQLLVAAGAVLLVTVVDWLYGRMSGRPMPRWVAPEQSSEGGHRGGQDRRPVG